MSEGGKEAVRADDAVVPASEVRRLEERLHELERLLGRNHDFRLMKTRCTMGRYCSATSGLQCVLPPPPRSPS
jgi:hypothetical protein